MDDLKAMSDGSLKSSSIDSQDDEQRPASTPMITFQRPPSQDEPSASVDLSPTTPSTIAPEQGSPQLESAVLSSTLTSLWLPPGLGIVREDLPGEPMRPPGQLEDSEWEALSSLSPEQMISVIYAKTQETLGELPVLAKLDLLRLPAKIWRSRKFADENRNFLKEVAESVTAEPISSLWSDAEAPDPEEVAQKLSFAAWGCAKCGYRDEELFAWIAEAVSTNMKVFDITPISMLVWSMGKLRIDNRETLDLLCARAALLLREATDQNIANIYWALGSLQYPQPDLAQEGRPEVLEILLEKLPSFNPQALANFVWALGHLGWRNSALLNRCGDVALRVCDELKPQELSNTLWGFAKVGYQDTPNLILRLSRQARNIIDELNVQEISNVYWAIGTLNFTDSPLTPSSPQTPAAVELIQTLRQRLPEFNAQAVANFTWSCARLQWKNPRVLFIVMTTIKRLPVRSWKPQNLANLVWAIAKLRLVGLTHRDDRGSQEEWLGLLRDALDVMLSQSMNLIDQFKPQELSNLYWGGGNLRHQIESCRIIADRKLKTDLLSTLAKLRCDREEYLSKLYNISQGFKPQEISTFLCGLMRLGWNSKALVSHCVIVLQQRMDGLKAQELSNAVWSLTFLGHDDIYVLLRLFTRCSQVIPDMLIHNITNLYESWNHFTSEHSASIHRNSRQAAEKLQRALYPKGMARSHLVRVILGKVRQSPKDEQNRVLSKLASYGLQVRE